MNTTIQLTALPRYVRALAKYAKNNEKRREEAKRSLKLLRENPSHPGLNTELLKNTDMWSIRVNKSDRIFFRWIEKNKHALLWDIGAHDKYRRY